MKLRETAIEIVERHGGEVPNTVEALATLPGIGPYTSRSVAVHAFGLPVAPLDTNVRRVARRFFGTDADLQINADTLVAGPQPARVVRALMDLATLVCRPKSPACQGCPLARRCSSAFAPPDPHRPAKPAQPFIGSRRWLHGRVIERLSTVPHGQWLSLDELAASITDPGLEAVARRLASEGLVEFEADRLRLAV